MKTKMIVLFAHWCPICNMMMPIVEEIEAHYKEKIQVIRIDVECESGKMEEYEAEIVPTFIFVRDNLEIGRMAGLIGEKMMYDRIEKMCL